MAKILKMLICHIANIVNMQDVKSIKDNKTNKNLNMQEVNKMTILGNSAVGTTGHGNNYNHTDVGAITSVVVMHNIIIVVLVYQVKQVMARQVKGRSSRNKIDKTLKNGRKIKHNITSNYIINNSEQSISFVSNINTNSNIMQESSVSKLCKDNKEKKENNWQCSINAKYLAVQETLHPYKEKPTTNAVYMRRWRTHETSTGLSNFDSRRAKICIVAGIDADSGDITIKNAMGATENVTQQQAKLFLGPVLSSNPSKQSIEAFCRLQAQGRCEKVFKDGNGIEQKYTVTAKSYVRSARQY